MADFKKLGKNTLSILNAPQRIMAQNLGEQFGLNTKGMESDEVYREAINRLAEKVKNETGYEAPEGLKQGLTIGADFVLDPVNLIPGGGFVTGSTKGLKIAKMAPKLLNAAKPIVAGGLKAGSLAKEANATIQGQKIVQKLLTGEEYAAKLKKLADAKDAAKLIDPAANVIQQEAKFVAKNVPPGFADLEELENFKKAQAALKKQKINASDAAKIANKANSTVNSSKSDSNKLYDPGFSGTAKKR